MYFLPTPDATHLDLEQKNIDGMEIGHAAMQGLRVQFEDKHVITSLNSVAGHSLVGMFDGHAGTLTAEHAAQHMADILESTVQWKKYASLSQSQRASSSALLGEALVQTYVDLDTGLKKILVEGSTVTNASGSTAVCALITPTHIICANLGDSRCILGTKSSTVAMCEDHKPSLPLEKKRIANAGGKVLWDRVNGMLAMSRALGDFSYKMDPNLSDAEQLVIAFPDIAVHERNYAEDEVLVLACDGVWDVVTNEEAISFVTSLLNGTSEKGAGAPASSLACAEALIDWALERESSDNISAIVVKLPGEAAAGGSKAANGATKRKRTSSQ